MYQTSQVSTSVSDALKKLKADSIDNFFADRDCALDYYQYNNTGRYISNYFGGS